MSVEQKIDEVYHCLSPMAAPAPIDEAHAVSGAKVPPSGAYSLLLRLIFL